MGGSSVDIMRTPVTERRTVYAMIDRQDLPNLLRVFEFASPDESTSRHPQATVPQQALFLLNSPFVNFLTDRLLAREDMVACKSWETRVERIYERILQRRPSSDEREWARTFLLAK